MDLFNFEMLINICIFRFVDFEASLAIVNLCVLISFFFYLFSFLTNWYQRKSSLILTIATIKYDIPLLSHNTRLLL